MVINIIVSFLNSEESFQYLTIRYDVSCRVFEDVFYQIEEISFYSSSYGCIAKLGKHGKKKKKKDHLLYSKILSQKFGQTAVRNAYLCFTVSGASVGRLKGDGIM